MVPVTLTFHIAPATVQPVAGKTDFSGQVGLPLTDDAQLSPAGTQINIPDPTQLPPGVTVSSSGAISGTPSAEGDYTVQAELS